MSLFDAIEDGDLRTVRKLIRAGTDIEQIDEATGAAPLALAAECGNVDVVQILLRAGASPDWGGATTPLEAATLEGHIEVVRALIRAFADVNRPVADGFTPLITAASTGNLDMVRMLLKAGAIPGVNDDEGETALTIAKKKGHADIVAELSALNTNGYRHRPGEGLNAAIENRDLANVRECLKQGTDLKETNRAGLTPLARAAELGHLPIIRALLKAGADIELGGIRTPLYCAVSKRHEPVVRELLDEGANVNAPSEERGTTPVMCAAATGNPDVVRLLLDEGADPGLTDQEQHDALWAAASQGQEQVFAVLASLVKASGRKPAEDELATHVNRRKDVAANAAKLIDLIHEGSINEAKRMLASGTADPDGFDEEGRTALMIAAAGGHRDLVRLLIAAGASFEVGDDVGPGWTALIHAIRSKALEPHATVNILAAAGADVSHASGDGTTPLMHAVETVIENDEEDNGAFSVIVESLLHAGAKLEIQDAAGLTVWMRVKQKIFEESISSNQRRKLVRTLRTLEKMGARAEGTRRIDMVIAVQEGRDDEVQGLLRTVNDPKALEGLPVLSIAAANNHWNIVSMLLDAGLDIDTRNMSGQTVLMQAAAAGDLAIVEQMVEAGADPTLTVPPEDTTARDLAEEAGHDEVAQFLKKLTKGKKK
ncbi:MAG: hypothetical protein GY856_33935 [bacterium]|nr:hypothetical protein [bacterium]